MDNPQKFSNSKEVIAFLAETFPACFSLKGQAKPLKIGIFQDLAERLNDDERVSKTLLRSTLRHYTNSWRYLESVKQGAHRVDLDGNQGEQIEQEHAEHAQAQLKESKERAAEKRAAQKPADGEKKPAKKKFQPKGDSKGTKSPSRKPIKKGPPPQKLTSADMVEGTKVTVKVGKAPMPATILDVAKDGIQVQLDSGMQVKVQAENLRLAK